MRRGRAFGLVLLLAAGFPAAAAPDETSCTACHGDAELFDEESVLRIVEGFGTGVHAAAGLSCHDCHGGNPDLAMAEDIEGAMDPAFAASPYRGAPARTEVPGFCGRCHSSPEYMKRFKPDARVDQEREYWTSHHGKALVEGDEQVATCIDCHSTHGILGINNPDSPVYPMRVAETCRRCHADAERMAGYTRADGRPLPIDQYARWRRSVHADAMLKRGDPSAPTCNDCHGNHGATPPGLDSVAFVCGQCHQREATLFRASAKREGFRTHEEEYLVEAGGDCAVCHEAPEPQAALTDMHHFTECVTCHGNHSVIRPTLAMLAPLPETPCAFCHEPLDGADSALGESAKTVAHYRATRDALLAEAGELEGERLFDWLMDRIHELPMHTITGPTAEGETTRLRPEVERLLTKFRLGKIHYTFLDPATGREVQDRVVRCTDCHSEPPALGGETGEVSVRAAIVAAMRELTTTTARAERTVLAARRGGVEVQEPLLDLDKAIDAQIQLEALVHGFAVGEGTEFHETQQEGLEHAWSAVSGGEAALAELGIRRRGLIAALFVIVLVLIGLALKIRQLSASSAP